MTLPLDYRFFIVVTFILSFAVLWSPLNAQEYSDFNVILDRFEAKELSASEAVQIHFNLLDHSDHQNSSFHKCITPLGLFAHKHWEDLTEDVKDEYRKVFEFNGTLATENYISPSGNFRVQYETTGSDAVPSLDENNNSIPDYVEWIGQAADSSYDRYIALGYTDIFSVKSVPFDIIVANSNAYGFVPPNAPYIGIENDFIGFPENTDPEGDQKGAVKVTIAHELKHVFQFVQNGWSGDPDRWLEMDATLYEEVMYDEVNDYYNYLENFAANFFGSPTTSIIPGSYEDITWALYFEERFGNSFWTTVWNRIENEAPNISFFQAIREALADYDVSFEEAAIENFLWHFSSGPSNSTPFFGFDERYLYPGPRIQQTITAFQLEMSSSHSMARFSGRYFEVDLIESTNSLIKFDFIPSSDEVQVGIIAFKNDDTIDSLLVTNPDPGQVNIVEYPDLQWSEVDRLGIITFNSSNQSQTIQFQIFDYSPVDIESPQLAQNYPNPFNPSTTINVVLPSSQRVKLTVYDYLGREIRILIDGTLGAGNNPIPFDAFDLASGIYFYRLETEEKVLTRTMTLIK